MIDYFNSIRSHDMMRQEIGRQDLSMRRFEGIKKVSKIFAGSSERNAIKAMHFYLLELHNGKS